MIPDTPKFAKYLHYSVPTVCRLVKSGKIEAATRRIGATYWFDKRTIKQLMRIDNEGQSNSCLLAKNEIKSVYLQ